VMVGGLTAEEAAVVEVVREFVDREVRPVVRELEHADAYPEALIEQMKRLGVFGLAVPEPYGEAPVSMVCYALVTAELARGWMSLAGAMGGHTVVAKLIVEFGTEEQKQRYLPRMATGALLCKTDPTAEPRHRGMSILLVEPGPGLTISKDLPKLGYKGVESCELTFDDMRVPGSALLGGRAGRGFGQMMRGLETGRIQVAARAVGVAQAAFDDALRYAQERESFGRPIWQHQSVGNLLADMATATTAARQLLLYAAERADSGQRADLEAGMAKLFASETAMQVALNAVRVHGGYGYSTEFDVERYFRDAPLMIVGEGTNEIQRDVIAAQLVRRGRLP
jgi:alkylation response protein AidB-like acyl-CoA dehydrogenase